jgi:hypothetical protein
LLRSARNDEGSPAAALLGHVTAQAARLAASYIAAGFVHGVLNSDNIAITAQSFDYGPWRFAPSWDGAFTAAYFDHGGLYSFARQPEAIHWDLVQLAIALRQIEEAEPLTAKLEAFPALFQQALRDAIFARLGLQTGDLAADMPLVAALEETLAASKVPLDRFWFDWRGGRAPEGYEGFEDVAALIARHEPVPGARDHPYWSDPAPCSMHIEEVESIWSAIDERDDWTPLHEKIAAVRRMGEAHRAA